MIGLPQDYRFSVKNNCGQTIAVSGVEVTGRRVKFDSTGVLNYESTEKQFFVNNSTILNNGWLAGQQISNSGASDSWLGGDFTFKIVGPASAAGDVQLFLDKSQNGTIWDSPSSGVLIVGPAAIPSVTGYVSFGL